MKGCPQWHHQMLSLVIGMGLVATPGCRTPLLGALAMPWQIEPRQRVSCSDAESIRHVVASSGLPPSSFEIEAMWYCVLSIGGLNKNVAEVYLVASDASREGRILTLKKKSGVWEVTERVRTYDGVALGEGVSVGDAQMILDVIRRTRSVQPWEDDETYSIPESREHLPRRIARDYVVHYIDGELEAGTPSLELDKQADFAVSTHDPKAERIGGEDIFVRWQEIFLRRTESGMEAIAIF